MTEEMAAHLFDLLDAAIARHHGRLLRGEDVPNLADEQGRLGLLARVLCSSLMPLLDRGMQCGSGNVGIGHTLKLSFPVRRCQV